ncbi:hypothetical protein CWI38_1427p0010 [Hamiltosporidium tvaerminnensis]|uniref:Uncharacterized protein n=1 Tax=Hamiltosporidium tvaerminnensis TaxID=1176355 RepID=A0A4Q9LTX9_9MICR|nr:hypothetical protein CWI38_1427p0010 [Hamiltosporidium tvaerminnensis]
MYKNVRDIDFMLRKLNIFPSLVRYLLILISIYILLAFTVTYMTHNYLLKNIEKFVQTEKGKYAMSVLSTNLLILLFKKEDKDINGTIRYPSEEATVTEECYTKIHNSLSRKGVPMYFINEMDTFENEFSNTLELKNFLKLTNSIFFKAFRLLGLSRVPKYLCVSKFLKLYNFICSNSVPKTNQEERNIVFYTGDEELKSLCFDLKFDLECAAPINQNDFSISFSEFGDSKILIKKILAYMIFSQI